MINPELLKKATERAQSWLDPAVDEQTRQEVQALLNGDTRALVEAFYSDLEFGTGGLRGIMGVGSMRMNRYTVGTATQGLANYINSVLKGAPTSVAIAFDSRNNSPFFARVAADVLSANGIRVYLFDELRPTPVLSFTVRELGCQAGIVITASHNPPEYNGYKVYWSDGGQVLPPHDKGIISEVRKVTELSQIRFSGNPDLIFPVPDKVEKEYLRKLRTVVLEPQAIEAAQHLRIVYTPLHGSGGTMVPVALKELGFRNVSLVKEQSTPDGDFPTVESPNPEEREALSMALSQAQRENADIVLATDPDADRVGLAIRNDKNELVLINGNQAGSMLVYYQLLRRREKAILRPSMYVAKTIVTTDLITRMAVDFETPVYETLTGFKYIAGVIGEREGAQEFIGGGEESYGYLVGEFVRDKDAVLSAVVFAEIGAWCASRNRSMWDLLMEMYTKYGLFHEQLVSITLKGLDGLTRIQEMMAGLRQNPPKQLGGSEVTEIRDVASGLVTKADGNTSKLDLPSSNVLQFVLADGSKISARPSGTEPKIKFYFSIRESFEGNAQYEHQVSKIADRISQMRKELGI